MTEAEAELRRADGADRSALSRALAKFRKDIQYGILTKAEKQHAEAKFKVAWGEER
jgi:hypothetical protein